MNERKYYIDNLRILCILLLFPFHTMMIFNNLGEDFYVLGAPSELLTYLNIGTYAWWMTGLFVLAGMSTKYAIQHRSIKQYCKERVHKLFIPFLAGLVLVVPMQTYLADRFHNGYQGNYFEHLIPFLKITDFSGYDGRFTPAHLWFALYLFIIAMVCVPLIAWYQTAKRKINTRYLTMPVLLVLGVPVALADSVLNIGGKSFVQFGLCFLLGYFIFSEEEVIMRLEQRCISLGIAWALLIISRCVIHTEGWTDSVWWGYTYRMLAWVGILAMLGLARRFLNHNWKFTKHFVKREFSFYIFHQTIIIMMGYVILPRIHGVYLQYLLIMLSSFVITYMIYELAKRVPVLRYLFAIK